MTNKWKLRSANLVILAFSAAWIWMSRAEAGTTTNGLTPSPQTGFFAPDFTLQNQAGESVRLSDFRGQPVLLNLWASWCLPCRSEMPAMQRVYDDLKEEGFVVLAVNITSQDSRSRAVAFVEEYGLSFPILFDSNGDVARAYQMRAFPSSFFIDREGVIREIVIGGPMAEALLRIRADQLMKGDF